MSQICTFPNIAWRIDNLAATDEISSPIVFMKMKWKLKLIHLLNTYNNLETLHLYLKRLSPVSDLQAKLKFCIYSHFRFGANVCRVNDKTEIASMSYRNWCLNSADVNTIKKSYANFTLNSPIIYHISISSYGEAWGQQNLHNLTEDQEIPIPLSMSSLSEDFSKLLTDDVHSDVVLKCDKKVFCAHKAILSARSEVFTAMFRSDMKETREGIVCITDMEPDILEQFLYYLYSGKLSDMSVDTACKIYAAADKYGIDALKIKCGLFIAEKYAEKSEENSENDANNQQNISLKEKSLRNLFNTMEWKTLVQENCKLASEMCRPLLIKDE